MHVTVSLVNMAEGVLVALLDISALVKMETLASTVVSVGIFGMYSRVGVISLRTFVLIRLKIGIIQTLLVALVVISALVKMDTMASFVVSLLNLLSRSIFLNID